MMAKAKRKRKPEKRYSGKSKKIKAIKRSTSLRSLSAKKGGKPEKRDSIETLKQQLEFILNATRTGLDIIDSEFNLRYIDPGWAKVYGDPTGKKCYLYFMGRNEMCQGCGIPTALKTKKIMVTEERLARERNRPIQVTRIPFQNNSGE